MIPEAAVEAAARAYYGTLTGGWMSEWGYLDRQAQDDIMRCMRAALEAAAPHMMADLRKLVEDMEAQPWTEMGTVRGMAALIRSTMNGTL